MIEEDISTIGSHAPSLGMHNMIGDASQAELCLDTTENGDEDCDEETNKTEDVALDDDDDADDEAPSGADAKAPTCTLNTKGVYQTSNAPKRDLDLCSALLGEATATKREAGSSLASPAPPHSWENETKCVDTLGLLAVMNHEKISAQISSALLATNELLNGSQNLQVENMSSVGSISPTLDTTCFKKSKNAGFLDSHSSDAMSTTNPDFDIRHEHLCHVFENDSDVAEANYITDDISTVGSYAPTLATKTSAKSELSTGLFEAAGDRLKEGRSSGEDDNTDAVVFSSTGSDSPTLSTKKSILSSSAMTGYSEHPAAEYVTGDISTVGSSAPTIGTRTTNKTGSTARENPRKFFSIEGRH